MMQDPMAESGWSWRHPGVLLLLACAAGLGLRLLFLGSKSFWLDEAFSLRAAGAAADALWTGRTDRNLPPLYYALLHYWLPLGTSEFTLRLSSALLGVAAIPASYALARRLAAPAVAVSAAWLAALSPLLVWYSQELRSYSLLTLLGLVMGLAVIGLSTRWAWGWWLLLVATMTTALYLHYIAALLLLAQVFVLAVLHVQGRLRGTTVLLWLAALPVVALLYWPWLRLPVVMTFWRSALGDRFMPVALTAATFHLSTEQARVVVFGGFLAAAIAALLIAYPLIRQPPATWAHWRRAPGVRVALLLLVLAATVVTVVPRVYTIKKLIVALWPYFLLVVAWFWPWQAAYRRTLTLILVASLAGALVNVSVIPKDQWREVARYLAEHRQPGDGLWVQPYYHTVALDYYADGALPPVKPDVDGAPAALAEQAAGLSRVWYVYGARDVGAADPQQVVPAWLDANLRRVDSAAWYGIRLTLYARRE